jgi:hypothetical protein
MWFDPRHLQSNISGTGDPNRSSPLFGVYGSSRSTDPGQKLARLLDEGHPVETTRVVCRGMDCVQIVVSFPTPGPCNEYPKWTYIFCPAKGYCAVSVDMPNKDLVNNHYTCDYVEFIECAGGRWFPKRIVECLAQNGKTVQAQDIDVTELNVDNSPPRDVFEIDMRRPARSARTISGKSASPPSITTPRIPSSRPAFERSKIRCHA